MFIMAWIFERSTCIGSLPIEENPLSACVLRPRGSGYRWIQSLPLWSNFRPEPCRSN